MPNTTLFRSDVQTVDEVELFTGLKVDPVVSARTQVRFAIEKYIAGVDALKGLDHDTDVSKYIDEHDMSAEGDVPVIRLVNQLLSEAIRERASDVHIEPGSRTVRVRYRVDGVLREAATLPKSSQAELISRLKVMAEMDITERRRPQDGRIALRIEEQSLDLRVATLPTPNGETIVLRILDTEVSYHDIDDVGMEADDLARVMRMMRRPYGALLVSGPTGSGKSTTMYGLLGEVTDTSVQIITVEDPIEYRMEGITQTAINARIGLTFAVGLRTILRADPDVIMVGEVRDPETAEIAIRAALTGHLVLTSIHTNDAPSALTRLNDMGVPPYITSSALLGAVAQRLVRVLCPECKEPAAVTRERLLIAGFSEAEADTVKPMKAVGCPECSRTGYRGRSGVFEVMEFTEELSALFIQNAASEELHRAAVAQGMRPLRRAALDKVAAGITTIEEIDRVVV